MQAYFNKENKTNISYYCIDRHAEGKKQEDGIIWEGNYYDDNIHDCAQLSWETVRVLTNKIANVIGKYCKKGDTVLLLLPHVIQLPISIVAASRIGVTVLPVNPVEICSTKLTQIIEGSKPSLIISLDGFWQGQQLLDTKNTLDKALKETTHSVKAVLIIRHCAPNEGVPPPDVQLPARRPCYTLKVEYTSGRDIEWSDEIRVASTTSDIVWLDENHLFALIPSNTTPVTFHRITNGQVLQKLLQFRQQLLPSQFGSILSLPHPETELGLFSLLTPWFNGKPLAIFEGVLDYPDPSRLMHIISKFEIEAVVLPQNDILEDSYMSIVKTPSLNQVLVEPDYQQIASQLFKNIKVDSIHVQ